MSSRPSLGRAPAHFAQKNGSSTPVSASCSQAKPTSAVPKNTSGGKKIHPSEVELSIWNGEENPPIPRSLSFRQKKTHFTPPLTSHSAHRLTHGLYPGIQAGVHAWNIQMHLIRFFDAMLVQHLACSGRHKCFRACRPKAKRKLYFRFRGANGGAVVTFIPVSGSYVNFVRHFKSGTVTEHADL